MQNIIAVVFDFDDTLAPDSTSSFLESIGVDVPSFWSERAQALVADGWDPVLAYLYEMIRESESREKGEKITRQLLASWGRTITCFNGATRIFSTLRRHVQSLNSDATVEFYMVSSGLGVILRHTRIASQFKDIWASEFHFDENDEIAFPKNVLSFTDKTRYLFQICKGIVGPQSRDDPFAVNRKAGPEGIRVPFDQMIFLGDGYTDVPCFSLVRKNGGVAIGVYDTESRRKWKKAWGFIEDGRVSNLVRADYGKNASLRDTLLMATESIAQRILLRNSSYQG
ncbi:MAG: haloacid dehalogenase-like hydrolase [Candidatus Pacebacteria bacterium]|nr:haloacid dehalogenase-like hydrolase [Candidatus Paceibacterota bacterium]